MDWAASFSRGQTKKCKDRVFQTSFLMAISWKGCGLSVFMASCVKILNVASLTEMKRNSGDCDALAAHHWESAGIFEKVDEVTVSRPIKTDSSPNGRDRN